MIDMLSKPVGEITIGDIQTLIESTIPESEQIEFKEAPPATNGIDPWMSGGNIGDHAKNKILEEVVAFANAYGGVLLLGVKESSTNPSTAEEINPVPRCADLADRLKLVFRDCVEPHLPRVEIVGVPVKDDSGSGRYPRREIAGSAASRYKNPRMPDSASGSM